MNPTDRKDTTKPVAAPLIQPKKTVILLYGDRSTFAAQALTVGRPALPKRQAAYVHHHTDIVELLKFIGQPTDGSVVILRPGTIVPFGMDNQPYADVTDGCTLEVVPNRADHIGPFATEAEQIRAESAAKSLVNLPPAPNTTSIYPKLLSDPKGGQPDVLVHTADAEKEARAKGLTSEIPAPPAV